MVFPPVSTKIDARRRRFFGLAESQAPQPLFKVGTPTDEPQPKIVTRIMLASVPWKTNERN